MYSNRDFFERVWGRHSIATVRLDFKRSHGRQRRERAVSLTFDGKAPGGSAMKQFLAAQLGAPGEYIDYAATKAAIEAMTVGLAKEVVLEGIRVNGVRPGIIHTEIHASRGEPNRVERVKDSIPMKRASQPEEGSQCHSMAALR